MLKIVNLTKDFGGVRAVDNVSFSVKKGEILSIIGPNGAGKTTLFNLLTGLIKPTKGYVVFDNKEIIPEDEPGEFAKLNKNSCLIAIYSLAIMVFFYFIYKNSATYVFEYTLLCLSILFLRLFAAYRLKQRVVWAKGFLSILLFFDVAVAVFFAITKHLFIPALIILGISVYFYLYFINKKTKHIFEEFLEAENIANMGIARTFQNIRLFQNLKVIENILAGFHTKSRSHLGSIIFKTKFQRDEEEKLRREAVKILEYVGIHTQTNNLASNLSYGEQRKLEIGRALAIEPQLLLLDEPAAGMNPKETQELLELIKKISNKGITIILIEHDMNLVMNISNRIVVLDYGEKIAEDLPENIRNNESVIKAYLGGE